MREGRSFWEEEGLDGRGSEVVWNGSGWILITEEYIKRYIKWLSRGYCDSYNVFYC